MDKFEQMEYDISLNLAEIERVAGLRVECIMTCIKCGAKFTDKKEALLHSTFYHSGAFK